MTANAMEEANHRFYAQHRPLDNFRTSLVSADLIAQALLPLLDQLADALPPDDPFDFVDVGAGSGELATAVAAASLQRPWRDRLRLVALDLRPRPTNLDEQILWHSGDARDLLADDIVGAVVAHEWLDDLGVDVISRGKESDLANSDRAQRAWIEQWWPVGDVIDVGSRRDDAWATVSQRLAKGFAVAIDYGHLRDARPASSTIVGFAHGTQTDVVDDGSVNVTAHVAIDACAAAFDVHRRAAGATTLARQADVLNALLPVDSSRGNGGGVDGRDPGPAVLTERDALTHLRGPQGLRALAKGTRVAEVIDPNGLGAHWWLFHAVGMELPPGFPTMSVDAAVTASTA